MYKNDIQFMREKYRELVEENDRLRDENMILKEINARYRELINMGKDGEEV